MSDLHIARTTRWGRQASPEDVETSKITSTPGCIGRGDNPPAPGETFDGFPTNDSAGNGTPSSTARARLSPRRVPPPAILHQHRDPRRRRPSTTAGVLLPRAGPRPDRPARRVLRRAVPPVGRVVDRPPRRRRRRRSCREEGGCGRRGPQDDANAIRRADRVGFEILRSVVVVVVVVVAAQIPPAPVPPVGSRGAPTHRLAGRERAGPAAAMLRRRRRRR